MPSYQELQKLHPKFVYQTYSYELTQTNELVCRFTYQLQNGPQFQHLVTYQQVSPELFALQKPELINNLVFNLGLAEMFSYWKLAASPTIEIKTGNLSSAQIKFWEILLQNGMGEYFYRNDFICQPQFIYTTTSSSTVLSANKNSPTYNFGVGIGGGKDSAVMVSLLQQKDISFANLIMRPSSPAAIEMAHLNGRPTYFITRQFDPQLFTLNQKNYLNGHVPFSAIFAFASLLAGVLYNIDNIVVGNESSANQPSLKWRERDINHQYSKSTKFEQDFQEYSTKYLIDNVNYYSLIRPFTELKIAQIFCSNPQYFSIFKSCNRGQQKNVWCHQCPKCLFVFLMLSPFIDEQILTTQIFDHNLFEDENLLTIFKQLLGLLPTKPLECVGSIEESQLAFYLTVNKYEAEGKNLPALLQQLKDEIFALPVDWQKRQQELLADAKLKI
ncbi:MAG: hypothetical protein Q4G02_01850 [bacterium]|nr:hypothetical protein [bacterium]